MIGFFVGRWADLKLTCKIASIQAWQSQKESESERPFVLLWRQGFDIKPLKQSGAILPLTLGLYTSQSRAQILAPLWFNSKNTDDDANLRAQAIRKHNRGNPVAVDFTRVSIVHMARAVVKLFHFPSVTKIWLPA